MAFLQSKLLFCVPLSQTVGVCFCEESADMFHNVSHVAGSRFGTSHNIFLDVECATPFVQPVEGCRFESPI